MSLPRRVLSLAGSLWFASVLLMAALVVMACATVYESMHGAPQALDAFYHARWFQILLALVAVNILAAVLVRWPFNRRQIGFVLTHASLLVIFVGAWVTARFGIDGQVAITEGATVDSISAGV